MPTPPPEDYYALLGVPPDADGPALHRAWRALAARWHPDRAGADAADMFQRVSVAYAVLSDPLARLAYDRRRREAGAGGGGASRPAAKPQAASGATRPPAPATMLSRLSRPLAVLLATGAARFDEAGFVTLVLTRADAEQGGMVSIAMPVEVWCPGCVSKPPMTCARCAGRRTVDELFSAWLAIPPGVTEGEEIAPSAQLPGVVEPVRFRIRMAATT